MIELDLFGSWGKYFIEEWKKVERGSWQSVLSDYRSYIKLENIRDIPKELLKKEFAGRISFADTNYGDRNSVNDGYEVVSGYFPTHFSVNFPCLFLGD